MIDALHMTEDRQLIADAVDRLCADYGEEYWQKLDAVEAYPEEFVDALTAGGWLAIHIPEEYGGGGMGLAEASIVMEHINRSGANGAACHAQMYQMHMILRNSSEEQKRQYLPQIASGELRLQAFAVTEPDAGTDTPSSTTRAHRTTAGWLLQGRKVFTSRVQHSDLMVILARTTPLEECSRRTDGMSLFLVDLKKAGGAVQAIPIRTMVNHETNELLIDNLELPRDALIGVVDRGFYQLLDALNAERILIASECVGDARWFLARASQYGNERRIFDRPIGQNQGVQFPLADAFMSTEAADAVRWSAVAAYDEGGEAGPLANMAKYLASEAAIKAGDAAMTTFGGWGMTVEYGIERKFREARLYRVAPITNNLVLAYVGTKLMGLPKSY